MNIHELVYDVFCLIFEDIDDVGMYSTIRLVCKQWDAFHRRFSIERINKTICPQYVSLTDICREKKLWLPYVGNRKLYIELARKIANIVGSDDLYYMYNWDDINGFKNIRGSLKMLQGHVDIWHKYPIVIELEKKTVKQRENVSRNLRNFAILLPASTKTVKDLSSCPTCGYICKHMEVTLGHNVVEPEVIISVHCKKYDYGVLSVGEKVGVKCAGGYNHWAENFILERDESTLKNIRDHINAARELGIDYLKYFPEESRFIFVDVNRDTPHQ